MDIYFNDDYGKLYESIENGKSEVFEFTCGLGKIKNQFIKRKIPNKINNTTYFDIVTPYGYGGPLITEIKDKEKINDLVEKYIESFKEYCEKNNIVSEFIRFHPIIGNVNDFKDVYEVKNIRKTLGTNLKDYTDPIQVEFSKSSRKTIRQVLKKGITYRVIEKPENIRDFKEIYYSTMDRNEASEYYYFDDEYFEKCLTYFRENLIIIEVIYDDKVIASGLYFVCGNILQAHLSGTLNEYLEMSPAYITKYATALWAIENGIDYIHYGGGTTNSIEDSLYKFKKKFSQNTEFDFYIGKKIWNMDIYNELCKLNKSDIDDVYFPAYRKVR
ncbi:GNAT family N-acetyltransferase [Romboutsia ilealis]|uniref:GNAT family N-acetyltransferase n=1 Tax=Romboutsia faecis TaxID=2764597 RepID=A0ABR7JLL1_9FIRM|nr:GNAT family N-acetyltransferase [Romboutsia faecis]MBC5995806.1 GNAT family N-acetyltransferase [Romboutsia faecis]MRN23005.1 GNAT family N-acetyltransferase [Romboutsia ilealis]